MKKIFRLILKNHAFKKIIYFILKMYLTTIGNILYVVSKKYASFHSMLMHYCEWVFSEKNPSHYKHEIDLYNWIYDSSRVEFVEGGGVCRLFLNNQDNILDICSGDGSFSYLFCSDIASKVDAIDYDLDAINYAKKTYGKKNINYIHGDILSYKLDLNVYDMVIWSAGIAYFSELQRSQIFNKIYSLLNENGICYLYTPLEPENSSAGAGQKETIYHVTNKKYFEKEFSQLFDIVFHRQTTHKIRTNLYYVLKKC